MAASGLKRSVWIWDDLPMTRHLLPLKLKPCAGCERIMGRKRFRCGKLETRQQYVARQRCERCEPQRPVRQESGCIHPPTDNAVCPFCERVRELRPKGAKP